MIRLLHKKLQAGALQYTLFISVLILLLISSFITLTYLQQLFKGQTDAKIQCIQNAAMGFDYFSTHLIPYNQEELVTLDENIKSDLLLERTAWGFFDILKVTSTIKNTKHEKIGLTGGYLAEKPALYLKDLNNALVIVGDAKIVGTTFLPKKLIKSGNIAGNSYYGGQLVYGSTFTSTKQLPKLKNKETIENLAQGIINESNLESIELYEGLDELHSFNEPTKIYQQYGVIDLYDIKLSGNFIIQADSVITVSKTALLADIILVAPTIIIKPGVRGNFQAFASEAIEVGENCLLDYPTTLVVSKNPNTTIDTTNETVTPLFIKSNTTIKGVIAYLDAEDKSNYFSQLFISENTHITGEVYCEKNLELLGTIYGSVYTSSFIAKQAGSVYLNHLYNGQILQNRLPQQYVGLSIEASIPKVVKWLY
ncbi:hypothetical protein EC396_14235 [Lutibacter sp. HS1-25]|uniref:hypothetical protein n=1 Tax=Lutibacter sp. HS1-25 TaxID=2485000 RepID=UPI001011BF20|nr:hypothetical protein [Lutibacter sp. HS1-25]RXP46372.1 hypothetical protein EC396_14235 [Lutibacter sp. HS1-25]